MISLTTFIIYNSLFAFSMLPSANMKPASLIVVRENEKTAVKSTPSLPDVYMHIFASQNDDLDLNQYMPYVEIIANTFSEFKFHFIVLINDTSVGWMSAEENNELALNMLWTKEKHAFDKESRHNNINIEHVTLSSYMDNSPLKKYWRTLPYQLVEFVARTISIWDKGGVAINPDILTLKFQHSLYINKLQKILNKYAHTDKVISDPKFANKINKDAKKYRKLNNIRDIIEALEMEDISANAFSQQTLSEAENKDIQVVRHARQVTTVTESLDKNSSVPKPVSLNTINTEIKPYNIGSPNDTQYNAIVNSTESSNTLKYNHTSTKMSLLPLFLEFLFHNKADITSKPAEVTTNRERKSAILPPTRKENTSLSNNIRQVDKESKIMYKPLIVSAAGIYNKSKNDVIDNVSNEKDDSYEANRLIIDLKGNIIATDTPCHAFLGTIFSNVIHHSDEETVTDFIIAELTIFCKGLLSSCMGIDLILL